jgi:hypothetical protein
MKSALYAIAIGMLSTACSTTGSKSNLSTDFMGGDIRVVYNKSGEFESLISTAIVKVASELPSAREEAVTVATVKARRQISEFLKTEVDSERFVTTVTKSIQESNAVSGSNISAANAKIATEVKETIKQKSDSLLKGTVIESEKYDAKNNSIIVTVKTGAREVGIASTIKKLMSF